MHQCWGLLPVLGPGPEQDPGQGRGPELGVEQGLVQGPGPGLVQGLGLWLELVGGNNPFVKTNLTYLYIIIMLII